MMKISSINLFENYPYIPYKTSSSHLDRFIDRKDYKILYDEFSRILLITNKKLINKYIRNDFFHSSENLIILEPHMLAFNMLLKSITLERIIDENPKKKIIIDVFNEELNLNNRFLNQYAYIASKIGNPFEINLKGKCNVEYTNDPSVKNKIIGILNFKLKYILYEAYKKIGFKKDKFYFGYGRNYITREIEQELYFKGFSQINIESIKKDYKIFNSIDLKHDSDYQYVFDLISDVFTDFLNKHLKSDKVINALNSVFTELFLKNIKELLENKFFLRNHIKSLKKKYKVEFILSNGLFHNVGKSIYDAMKFNQIKVFSTEHGLTCGISKDSLPHKFSNESNTSDILFCYNNSSVNTHHRNNSSKTIFFPVGAHSFSKKTQNKSILRYYYRRRFKIKNRCIFYVSHNIELNVGKYYPYTKPCPEIFEDEKVLISTLGKVNKEVLYKSYPTKQYLDDRNNYINKLLKKHKNIKNIETEEDFRYMRNVADIVITQSSESTLEWCIGLNVPLIFLDSDFYEPLENEDVKNAFKKSFFFFNYDKDGWEIDLIRFLNKPYKEILSLWKQKQKYRNQYDEVYFLSKGKKAGKIGATLILDEFKK